MYKVLTIAGSDSGGGAGIQADIKTFSALGCYSASVITAITAQNTTGVKSIEPVSHDMISAQLTAVFDDILFDAVKIGMLHNPTNVETVASFLESTKQSSLASARTKIVLDPVMVSTSGNALLTSDAVVALQSRLLPLADIVTPNIPEATVLSGQNIHSIDDMKAAAQILGRQYNTNILVKGGHLESQKIVDILYLANNDRCIDYPITKITSSNTHGTGCTLSSAIAVYLAKQQPMDIAVKKAQSYLVTAIKKGQSEKWNGQGPVVHF